MVFTITEMFLLYCKTEVSFKPCKSTFCKYNPVHVFIIISPDPVWRYIGLASPRRRCNSCAECRETLQVFRYKYVDNPYFQVTLCDYSCLTERSRKVKFLALLLKC